MTELTAPHISEYLAESQRRANTTSEQEARAGRRATDAVAKAFWNGDVRSAELAMDAFLEAASSAQLIFLAKSEAHTLNQRPYISQAAFDELLLAECMRLTKGDVVKAQLLASVARE